jgi:hypothetical protein
MLLVSGFDDSIPPTGGKIFKIETNPDMVESIKIQSDESFDFGGFDIVLKQNSTGALDIMIPKNLPHPASFIGFWAYDERPIILAGGVEIGYDIIEDPCYSYYKIPIEGKTNLEILYTVILTGSWQLYSPIQFDIDNPCYNKVFYEKPLDSPLKQFKYGIPIDKITCKENLYLAYKSSNGAPTCVKLETGKKLLERGFAKCMETKTEYSKVNLCGIHSSVDGNSESGTNNSVKQKFLQSAEYQTFDKKFPENNIDFSMTEYDAQFSASATNKETQNILVLSMSMNFNDYRIYKSAQCSALAMKSGIRYNSDNVMVIPFLETTTCLDSVKP